MNKHILIVILSILFFQLNTRAQNSDPLSDDTNSQFNCTLACLDNITVAYSQNGDTQIWPLDFLEGSCEGQLKLTVVDENDNIVFEQQENESWTITADDVDKTYVYAIEHVETQNICWANILISDKLDGVDNTGVEGEIPDAKCLENPLDFTSFILEEELEFTGKTIEEIDTEVFISYFIAWDNMLLANKVDPQANQTIAAFSFSDKVYEFENGDIIVTRTFQLIDWCHYIPHSDDKIFTFEQRIIIRDLGSMLISNINFAESNASISINKMSLQNELGQAALVQLESETSISSAIAKTIETQGWESDSYQVEVEKYESCAEGISSIDLVQVLRHIINIQPLESNIRIIAADIDENNEITAADLVKMRRIILGLDNCDNESNWRFYNSDVNSDSAFNLDRLTEYKLRYSNESDMTDFSIVALKKGDVNLSALDNESEFRSLQKALIVKNEKVNAGQVYTVDFNLSKDLDVISAEIDFETPSFEILGFSSKSLDISESNYSINKKKSTVVFYKENPISLNEGDNILTLSLKASKDGTIENLLKSTKLKFNLYSSANSRKSISLGIEYIDSVVNSDQLTFTPITNQGTLTFMSNKTRSDVTIQNVFIFSMDGRKLHSLKDINVDNINIDVASQETQLLIYTLVTDQGYSQTGKFLVR